MAERESMGQASPPQPVGSGPDRSELQARPRFRGAVSLTLAILAGIASRSVAAVAAELYARQQRVLDLFGDSTIYWQLAGAIRTGAPFRVLQWDVPHDAIRTPGYPLFLAFCQELFGPTNTLAPRLAQAVLGGLGVLAIFGLVSTLLCRREPTRKRSTFIPVTAAFLFALEPYTVGVSALLLSEGLFIPIMLLGLWSLGVLWRKPVKRDLAGRSATLALAILTGLLLGAGVLVRPSWLLFVPFALILWVVCEPTRSAFTRALLVGLGLAAIMAPWWVRNARIYDRFVPTALWVGASLYDGVGPQATGASDMRFLERPEFRSLSETEQERTFLRLSWESIRSDPGRIARLALLKAGRFWSPWPNADELGSPGLAWFSALATLPLFFLVAVGLWDRRTDLPLLVLLAGPLLVFFFLHLLFVSSIRYRVPALVPAFGLAAIGLARLLGRNRQEADGQACGVAGRTRSELGRMLTWLLVLPFTVAAGAGWFAYTYVTDSSTLTGLIQHEAKRFLPGSTLYIRRGTIRPFLGELTLSQVKVAQGLQNLRGPTVEVGWLQVRCDLWALLKGQRRVNQLVLAQPTIRLARRPDGRWNLEGFLADPWPAPPLDALPQVRIEKGTIYLVEPDGTTAVLREVSATFDPVAEDSHTLRFEITAQGDGLDSFRLTGTYHLPSRRLEVEGGELVGLQISPILERRLPAKYRPAFRQLGLSAGVVDLQIGPGLLTGKASLPERFRLGLRLHNGTWTPPRFPYPLNDVSLVAVADEQTIRISRFSGNNGRTVFQAAGTLHTGDPLNGPLALNVDVFGLELDDRLKSHTPAEFLDLWNQFQPKGRTNVFARIVRARSGEPPGLGVTVDLQDMALLCRDWRYPLEHVQGRLNWEKGSVEIERLSTLIGNRPAWCKGKVINPGPNARVQLAFEFGALPVDETLFRSLPENMVGVIRQFQPTGWVRVREGRLTRSPPSPEAPDGDVDLTATLELGTPFAFKWDGLPYPVTDVTGQLVIGPGRWDLKNIKGWNGLAAIEGNGWVRTADTGPDRFDAELRIRATDLPFNDQLKQALPAEWKATWDILNPTGSTSLDAQIKIRDNIQDHRLTVVPEANSKIMLRFQPVETTPRQGDRKPLELPSMELDRGEFVYEGGLVSMRDVAFRFRGAPVSFRSGSVELADTGRFALSVEDLRVTNFRIDRELRQIMPPIMADFARRLDEAPPLPMLRGDLTLGWSGHEGEPAWVAWERGLVVFNGQTIRTGVPLQSLQGRLDQVTGRFDGRDLEVSGLLDLDSIHVLGQQVTQVKTPLVVGGGSARLGSIQGELLGGKLSGKVEVGLASTPLYSLTLAVEDADLARFTQTLPGRQSLGGKLSGQIALSGLGTDLRTARGLGDFKVRDGDLGELPVLLRLFKFLNPDIKPPTKTAFDSAEVALLIEEGVAQLNPIQLTGDAISLKGAGTMDFQGELDLRLRILYGRDRWEIPLLSTAMSEASGQIFDIHVTGPASFPRFRSAVFPRASALFRSFGSRAFRPRSSPSPSDPTSSSIPTPLGSRFGIVPRARERAELPPLPPPLPNSGD